MNRPLRRKRVRHFDGLWTFLRATEASSLAEFAISLPLLIVLVVGIFDFGGAFNQKQQLSNAMREAARFGASEATNDLVNTVPPSIDAIRLLVDSYLVAAKMNDCGLATATTKSSSSPWGYLTTGTCPGQLQLTIARDPQSGTTSTGRPTCALVATNYGGAGGNPIASLQIPCTGVAISYPYQWHFNSVIQLLVPGANLALTQIAASATAANMN
jgi:Flp pilus assembly protein TadG